MCRLFGFRSIIQSQVHSSLLSAENALGTQSQRHPDGWGVAYYVAGTPHLIKSERSALNDNLFKRVSGVVSSQTVVAHIRNATEGSVDLLNTHPFQFGQWVFAHNGNIKNFSAHKEKLKQMIHPSLSPFILGSTDSELIFYLLLTSMHKHFDLSTPHCPIDLLSKAVRTALDTIFKIIGDYSQTDDAGDTETYLTFLLTNGTSMIAHQGGKKLYYSTYKNRCSDRERCSSFSPECESPTKNGRVNHLIFASEPLSGENIWLPQTVGELIGIDAEMALKFIK